MSSCRGLPPWKIILFYLQGQYHSSQTGLIFGRQHGDTQVELGKTTCTESLRKIAKYVFYQSLQLDNESLVQEIQFLLYGLL